MNWVNGHVCWMLRWRASARTSCAVIRDFCNAILLTQLTVGELLLKSVMCLWAKSGAIALTQSHRNSRPAISRSELLIFPIGLLKDTRFSDTVVDHWSQKTIGGSSESSLTTTPQTLWLNASTIPMLSGHPNTRSLQCVGFQLMLRGSFGYPGLLPGADCFCGGVQLVGIFGLPSCMGSAGCTLPLVR